MMRFRIRYVDGELTPDLPAAHWPHMRREGVDWVEAISDAGRTRTSGHSVYWLYPEGDAWVMGGGSVRYDPSHLRELVVHPDGHQRTRQVEYMPDLLAFQVKLGWWRPGEARP